ncbi:sensor histidine kinase [Hanstruepera neustonica]|uniref:Sensor histidine kinase n=1 Tax=Hanstruepera neustonica TaxID=1445657 RepID=A0A2K1E121_9FLAO|nr:histidine kinase [Hanstruepera neustonica]PNQ73990.1 sensor histidine kinase [Hanstruepera neustonica]
MKAGLKLLVLLVAVCYSQGFYAQNSQSAQTFTVRGVIFDSEFQKPVSNANIEVNGGAYTTSNASGEFRIQVKKGDEIVIKHKDFETVYYTIKNQERIRVEVFPYRYSSEGEISDEPDMPFNSLIDSASIYLKTDFEKSIRFVTQALAESRSVKENSEVYEILGDIYLHWKQYDLAVTNYRISLQSVQANEVKLKLAKAYWHNKNYQESLSVYNDINKEELSNWQLAVLYQGKGDTYYSMQDFSKALEEFNKGLQVAKKHDIKPKVIDLNSKIAQTYDAKGDVVEAEEYFESSLNLAAQEDKKRALEEKVKVADFKATKQNFNDEIELRKEAIENIREIERDSVIGIESALTTQKQNYKIGNAYFLKNDFENAITYLDKSIVEAKSKNDLVVEKDATRKLSEVYSSSGDYNKALETYKEYTNLVEALYVKKEQEIIRAARFSREIANKQSRIASLETDRQLSESKYQLTTERNKRQQLWIYSLIGGLALLLVTAYFMYKYIKQQRLANNLLALKSLRSQMNPHFIFNALNSVNDFIAKSDERTANKYLTDFSFLMRAVLENSEEDFIPLEKEIELLERYTQLEHFRFQEKFDYTIDIDEDIDVSSYKIPPMLLQPYIENAVWHGLRYKTEKGHLKISLQKKSENEITISIIDDGIGRERSRQLKTENQKKHNSKGMSNIKKRVAILNDMYHDKVDVTIDDFQSEGDVGTTVIVTLKKD